MLVSEATLCALGGFDAADDVTALYAVALQLAEDYTGRTFEYGRTTETAYGFRVAYRVRRYPIDTIEAIRSGGCELSYRYEAESGTIILDTAERSGADVPIEITYTGGYTETTLPGTIVFAIILLIKALAGALESGGMAVASERIGDYSVTYAQQPAAQAGRLESISPSAAILLSPYRANALI